MHKCYVHVDYLVVEGGVEVERWEGEGGEEGAGMEGLLAVRGIHPDLFCSPVEGLPAA